MLRRVTAKEQIKAERQRALEELNKQKENESLIFEQLVDIDFRQSMAELGVL